MNIRHTHISSIFTFAHWSSGGNGTRNDGRNYIWFRTSRRRERLRLACCRRLKAIHSLLCYYCVSKIPSKWIRNDCVSVELCHNWNANLIQNISNAAKQKKNTKLYADIPKLDGPDTNIPCIKSQKWMPSRASVCVCVSFIDLTHVWPVIVIAQWNGKYHLWMDVILIAAMPIIQLILNYNVIIIYIYYIFVSVVLLLSGATMSGAK